MRKLDYLLLLSVHDDVEEIEEIDEEDEEHFEEQMNSWDHKGLGFLTKTCESEKWGYALTCIQYFRKEIKHKKHNH